MKLYYMSKACGTGPRLEEKVDPLNWWGEKIRTGSSKEKQEFSGLLGWGRNAGLWGEAQLLTRLDVVKSVSSVEKKCSKTGRRTDLSQRGEERRSVDERGYRKENFKR